MYPHRCVVLSLYLRKSVDIAAHNVLLAHAEAVDIYRRFFQKTQKGIIGITLNCGK